MWPLLRSFQFGRLISWAVAFCLCVPAPAVLAQQSIVPQWFLLILAEPSAPSGLNAVISGTQVNLTWSDTSSDETGFKLERRTGTGSYEQIATPNANATSYGDSSVTVGNTYSYRIRATNGVGDSSHSNEVSLVFAAPNAPTDLNAVGASKQFDLSWTDASTNETSFSLERRTETGAYAVIATLAANVTSYSDTAISAGVTYYYRISAVNGLGNSGYSNEITARIGQIYFVHTDHLNTPRLITNNVGQPVWKWDNTDPFGSNAPNENPSGLGTFSCNLRFPGQYFDKETNLHYNYFRDYDPAIGRYVQSDPMT